ncbi:MAG: DUF368 domain-containing protein [Clostridium sp.]
MEILINMLKGIVIGVSNIIPGVSGGTMAVVMGIYDKIMDSVTGFFKSPKKSSIFLGSLGLGAGLGIILFAKLIKFSLDKYPMPTNYLFIGLIIGTLPLLYAKSTENKINPKNYIGLVIALLVVMPMGLLAEPEAAGNAITTLTMINILKLFGAGFIAAATMILPGVSGSFVLLLLGLYDPIINAVSEFNIPVLFVVGVGVIIGFVSMTKVIDSMFKKFPQTTYFIILGLVGGSAIALVLKQGFALDVMGIVSIATLIIGFGVAYLIGKKEI